MEEKESLLNKFIIKLQGRDFILFEGLLHLAHQEGLKKVRTELIQLPSAENNFLAVVHAEVETTKGIFTGLGDASPESVNRNIAPHLIRLAETRALARALRFAINIGMTTVEELADLAPEEVLEEERIEGSKDNREVDISPENVMINFGKYARKTLGQILEEDRGYIEWLAENARDEVIRRGAKLLLEQLIRA